MMADEGPITTLGQFGVYCDHCSIPPPGRAYLRQGRTGIPSRAVQGGPFNVPNDFPSEKMGAVVTNESHTGELCFVYELEYSSKVREYYPQGPPLTYEYRGPKGKLIHVSTTPDFLVLEVDRVALVENKTRKQLQALKKKYPNRYKETDGKWTCPPASRRAAELGFAYEIRV